MFGERLYLPKINMNFSYDICAVDSMTSSSVTISYNEFELVHYDWLTDKSPYFVEHKNEN